MKKIAVFCSANNNIDPIFAEKTKELGEWIGKNNYTLVNGGCDLGLMESTAQAVHENGGRVIGVVPSKIEKNGHISKFLDVEIPCEDLSDRKQLMIVQSDIIIALPGGLGTLDEIFTVAAAATIGYTNKKVILYNVNGFWNDLLVMLEGMEKSKFMREPVSEHIVNAKTFEELCNLIENS